MFRPIIFSALIAFVLAQDSPKPAEVVATTAPVSNIEQKTKSEDIVPLTEESTNSPVVLKSYGIVNPIPAPAYAPSAPVRYIPHFPAHRFYPHRHHSRRSSSDSREGKRKKCDQCKKLRPSCEGQDEDLCKRPNVLHFERRGCKRAVVSCGSEGYQLFNEEEELIGASFGGDFLFSCHKKNWMSGDVEAKKVYCLKIED